MSGVCVCGYVGGLVARAVSTTSVDYRGVDGLVAMYYHECRECGSEFATQEDMAANKKEMKRFKKAIDKQMGGV